MMINCRQTMWDRQIQLRLKTKRKKLHVDKALLVTMVTDIRYIFHKFNLYIMFLQGIKLTAPDDGFDKVFRLIMNDLKNLKTITTLSMSQ